jgi:N-acetylneuraminic acid mutarotase
MVGGVGNCTGTTCDALASAELFDPATGTFTTTGTMSTGRAGHTATLLKDGRVLVVGGEIYVSSSLKALASAEIYDPSSGEFTLVGSMKTARFAHAETLLPDGRVLVTGGLTASFGEIASAELFDPATSAFSPTGSMATARDGQTATLLASGRVLIAGGGTTGSAELYDPATGTFAATGPMQVLRMNPTATVLSDGRVLLVGGENNCGASGCVSLNSAEVYDPAAGTFTRTGSMSSARWGQVAALLSDGRVLVAAGASGKTYYNSAEVYDPTSGTFSATSPLVQGGTRPTATALEDGSILVAGGWDGSVEIGSAEIYS